MKNSNILLTTIMALWGYFQSSDGHFFCRNPHGSFFSLSSKARGLRIEKVALAAANDVRPDQLHEHQFNSSAVVLLDAED